MIEVSNGVLESGIFKRLHVLKSRLQVQLIQVIPRSLVCLTHIIK